MDTDYSLFSEDIFVSSKLNNTQSNLTSKDLAFKFVFRYLFEPSF